VRIETQWRISHDATWNASALTLLEAQLPVAGLLLWKNDCIPKCRSLGQTMGLFATPEHLRFLDDAELDADCDEYLGGTLTVTKDGSIPRYQILPTPTKSSLTTITTVTSTITAVPMPLKQQFSETWPALLLLLGYLESFLTNIQTCLQALGNFSSAIPTGTDKLVYPHHGYNSSHLSVRVTRYQAASPPCFHAQNWRRRKRAQQANVSHPQTAFDTAQLR
jgi:hypothetical protein